MADIYWHNITEDNDGSKRENYSYDQEGDAPASAGSILNDNLIVGGGNGSSAQDDWEIPAATIVECESISFEGYSGSLTLPNGSEISATTISHLATGGSAVNFRGTLFVNKFLAIGIASNIAIPPERLEVNFTGASPKIQFIGDSSDGVTHFLSGWYVIDAAELEIESLVTGTDAEVSVRGGVKFSSPGGTLRKTGPGRFMHTGGNGDFFNIGQVLVEEGEYGLGQWPDGLNNSVGKGMTNNPGAVPIILSANTSLSLRANNDGVKWGVNLQVPVGSTGCRLRFSNRNSRLGNGNSNQAVWNINEDFEIFLDSTENRVARLSTFPILAAGLKMVFRLRASNTNPVIDLDWGNPHLSEIQTLLEGSGGNGRSTLRVDDVDALRDVQQITIGAGTYLRSNVHENGGGARIGGNVDIHPEGSIGMTFAGRAWRFQNPDGVYNLMGFYRTNNVLTGHPLRMYFTEDCQLNLRTASEVNGHNILVENDATVELNAGQTLLAQLHIDSGSTVRLAADVTGHPSNWVYNAGGVLDINGFHLTCPSFLHNDGTLDMNGGTITSSTSILLYGGTVENLENSTFNADDWQTQVDVVASSAWYLNATITASGLFVNVQNSDASGGVTAFGLDSNDLGGNINWEFSTKHTAAIYGPGYGAPTDLGKDGNAFGKDNEHSAQNQFNLFL